jgi:hypothetical protein
MAQHQPGSRRHSSPKPPGLEESRVEILGQLERGRSTLAVATIHKSSKALTMPNFFFLKSSWERGIEDNVFVRASPRPQFTFPGQLSASSISKQWARSRPDHLDHHAATLLTVAISPKSVWRPPAP